MIPAGSCASDEEVSQWRRRLHWSACAHAWVATTQDGTQVCVSEETYERCLDAYLQSVSIERKTWTEITLPAQEEWQRQCEAEHHLQSQLDFWLTADCPAVQEV